MKLTKTTKGNIMRIDKKEWNPGEVVIVHSIGDDKEYRAKIAGIASELAEMKIMIVELIDKLPREDYPYTHIAITEHCLKKIDE